jgi:hypothetical protein
MGLDFNTIGNAKALAGTKLPPVPPKKPEIAKNDIPVIGGGIKKPEIGELDHKGNKTFAIA